MGTKIVAIVGSYRKGGTTDSAIEAILAGAREKGAETRTFYLADQTLEPCTDCHLCAQKPGPERGICWQEDDLEPLLREIEAADGIVLGTPVNWQGDPTAVFGRFTKRLVGCTYWPWGQAAPIARNSGFRRKAALVGSSALPGFLIPIATRSGSLLRTAARRLGARQVGSLWIGMVGRNPRQALTAQVRERARRLGWKLA